jgi:hypothetical protein
LRNQGYDSIVYRNTFEGGKSRDSYIILNPENLRSKFAKFDPAETASPALSAGTGGKRPKGVKPDVPLGTPPKGKPKLTRSLGDMMAENEGASLVVARASGDKATISAVTKQAQERATSSAKEMVQSGSAPQAVWDKTGVVPITYEGKTLLVHSKDGPDQVYREFYQNIDKPLLKRPDWMRGFRSNADIDAAAKYRAEMDAIDQPLVLDKPLKKLGDTPLRVDPSGRIHIDKSGTKSSGGGGLGELADALPTLGAVGAGLGLGKTMNEKRQTNALAMPTPMVRNRQGQFVRPMTNRERQEAAR